MGNYRSSRRGFLGALAIGATAFTAKGDFADELTKTPTTNEGPFYPNQATARHRQRLA